MARRPSIQPLRILWVAFAASVGANILNLLMVNVLVGRQRHNAVYALTVRRDNRVEMHSKMESS
jgi:hypothetical protein